MVGSQGLYLLSLISTNTQATSADDANDTWDKAHAYFPSMVARLKSVVRGVSRSAQMENHTPGTTIDYPEFATLPTGISGSIWPAHQWSVLGGGTYLKLTDSKMPPFDG